MVDYIEGRSCKFVTNSLSRQCFDEIFGLSVVTNTRFFLSLLFKIRVFLAGNRVKVVY